MNKAYSVKQNPQDNTQNHSNRAVSRKLNQRKRVINRVLGILFFLQLLGIFLPAMTHRALGILFFGLLIIHLVEHKKWFFALIKGHYSKKRKQITLRNLLLGISILILIISGFFIPGTTHSFLSLGIYSLAGIIHITAAITSTSLLFTHAAQHKHTPIFWHW